MLLARGRARLFTDCDLPYALDAIPAILEPLRRGEAGVCIGARDLPASSFESERRWLRRVSSAAFTLFVSQISLRGFRDSQCGIKGFSAEAAERLFADSVVDGFAFDVEVLYLAHKYGLGVRKVPVRLVQNAPSSVDLWRDAPRMLFDVVGVPLRYHWRRAIGRRPG